MERMEYLKEKLELQKHPEGGYYHQVYKSSEMIEGTCLPERYKEGHAYSTAIYFMLTKEDYSAFHIINQDELWHHYEGASIEIIMIDLSGNLSRKVLGKNLENGEEPMVVVPFGIYFAARTIGNEPYSLVGCTVAPGFEFEDFYMPPKEELIIKFPQHKDIIEKLGANLSE